MNMFTKVQVGWTSTSSKTTLTKNFDLKRDRRIDERMNEQTTNNKKTLGTVLRVLAVI